MEWPVMRRKRLMLGGNDQFFDMDGMGLGYEIAKLTLPKSINARLNNLYK